MLIEDLRFIHEDNERLEAAIAERFEEQPRHIRDRLARDHQIAGFLERIRLQSQKALELYKDDSGDLLRETQSVATGDPYEQFYDRLKPVKEFHKRNPNEPVENLERAYKRRAIGEDAPFPSEVDTMFTGEEAFGRYFDMMVLHEEYVNLPGVKRRVNYMQYLDSFDKFDQLVRQDKMREEYFSYINSLSQYLETFMKRTKPLEGLERLFATWDSDFEKDWEENKVEGWEKEQSNGTTQDGPATQGTGEGIWCADCEKEFKTDNVYRAHLTGKKHIRAAAAREVAGGDGTSNGPKPTAKNTTSIQRLKERAIAEREFRVKKLSGAMQTERSDTRANVERKAGMTEKERAQELQALYEEDLAGPGANGEAEGDSDDEKVYNPLKLPLAWDGKPIPFWLYKLHGLGVEFACEICGNYVYMGRRAFDKHFSEARHLYGLKCLGITSSGLFRDITGIEEAKALWEKINKEKKSETSQVDNVVQMEDSEGNVMPEKVYYDLQKQGLL